MKNEKVRTETINIEPQWSNMTHLFVKQEFVEDVQPIFNAYQGYRDTLNGKKTEFAKAFRESLKENGIL
jgi:hypothetical protein|tara:strand:- start:614 stop:820 length:207 start_codon:yes stop_codon:yes gene_type:complete